ncbi:Protein MAINTENANCE OF MERISTEMS [Glycine max]|nr:Protein MAINTENANCE OF MERISTEMS [Glycine max]
MYVCENLQIMARTRGLRRALGRVIRRALGRGDNHDSDYVPQRRRPTTSARRQREVVTVAEDAPHVDDTAEKLFQHGEEVVDDAEGFLGGPHDTSMLTAYADHVVVVIWNGECHRAYVCLSWLREIYHSKCETGHWTAAGRAYLLHLLGCTIFANKSATHVLVVFLVAFRDLSQSGSYTWGATALVHMYDNLNDACKSGDRQLAGYITFLQAFTNSDYHESPRACRWTSMKASTKALPTSTYRERLDQLTTADVCWMPYGDHCAVREFDLISCFSRHIQRGSHCRHTPTREGGATIWMIPPHCAGQRLCFEDIDDRWMHFSDYLASVGQICVVPRQCAHDYMEWFYLISHPFMRPAQPGDAPRHPPVMQDRTYVEPNMPEIPMAPTFMEEAPAQGPFYVEQPRHAVNACQAIAERLERLLNLRIVTKGIEAHDVMQDYIRIARSVTHEHYVNHL